MKKWQILSCLGLCLLVIILVAGCGKAADSDYTIRVTGTAGLSYAGSYTITTADGQTVYTSIDGTVPKDYAVRGKMIACSFRKGSEDGLLKLEIIKDNRVVATSETTAAYGNAGVATR